MKKILGGLIAILLLFVAACVGSHFLLDQNIIRQQIVQAVKQQSTLELKISRASFQLLPWPSFHADELSLARPDCAPFVTARSVHADIAFLPLFHREIALKNLTVENGKASFQPNKGEFCSDLGTVFAGKQTEKLPENRMIPSGHTPWRVSFNALEIKETQLELPAKEVATSPFGNRLFVDHLILSDLKTDSPHLDFKGKRGEEVISLKGRLGSVHDFFEPGSRPWVFSLGLSFGEKSRSDQLTIDGVVNDLAHNGQTTLTLQGRSDNLQDWKNLFPQVVLPDISGLEGKVAFRVNDDASGSFFQLWGYGFTPTSLSLHMKEFKSTFSHKKQPVILKDVHLTADDMAPVLKVEGTWEDQTNSWHFMADSGSLAQIMALWNDQEGAVVPLDAHIRESQAPQTIKQENPTQFQLQGQISQQSSHITVKGSGSQLKLSNMAFLPSFWNKLLSGTNLRDFTFQTDVTSVSFSEQKEIDALSFENIQIKSQSLNGEGAVSFSRLTQTVPRFVAHFHFDSFDGNQFVPGIKDEKLPGNETQKDRPASFLDQLTSLSRKWDGLIDLKLGQFTLGGLTYHDLSFYGLMGDGKLTIDPMTAQLDDFPLKVRLAVGEGHDQSYLNFEAESVQLPASLLLKLSHQPAFLDGTIQLDGQLAARGHNRKELVDSLEGELGLSLTEGRIQKSVLMPLAGPAGTFLKMGKASMKLRCLAGKVNFHAGQADIVTMAMQAKHYALSGKGQVNMSDQTVNMLFSPHIELDDNEFSTPFKVTGSLTEPRIVPARNEQGYFQMSIGSAERDSCAEAVKEARGGHGGPALEKEEKHKSKVGSILKSLGIGGKF